MPHSKAGLLPCDAAESPCVTQDTPRAPRGGTSGPTRPPPTGLCSLCFSGLAKTPGSRLQPHPKRAQVENITMVTLVSKGPHVTSGKNATLVPNTWCAVGLQGEFTGHRCSWLAQRMHFSALCLCCGFQGSVCVCSWKGGSRGAGMCHLLSDERSWKGWCSLWEVGAPGLCPTCIPAPLPVCAEAWHDPSPFAPTSETENTGVVWSI